MHKAETLANHVIELIIPFFIFLPRPFRLICGVLQILFQVHDIVCFSLSLSLSIYIVCWLHQAFINSPLITLETYLCCYQVILILSGNLSFLNWLTILPAIYCFDDLSLRWLFSLKTRQRVIEIQQEDKAGVQRPWGMAAWLCDFNNYRGLPINSHCHSQWFLMNLSFQIYLYIKCFA